MLKFWRVGPNPMLTLVAWAGAGFEALAFNGMSETLQVGAFQVLLFSSLLCFWIAMVWAVWFVARKVNQIDLSRPVRNVIYVIVRLSVCLFIIFYALCWVIYERIHLFPDMRWLGFLRSSYEVLLYEVRRSSGGLLTGFFIFCGTATVGVFVFPRRLLTEFWVNDNPDRKWRMPVTVWLILLMIAVASYSMVITNPDFTQRQAQRSQFRTSVNPVFAMVSSLLPGRDGKITPDLDFARLEPIQPDSVIYSGDAPTTKPMSVLYLAVESFREDLLLSAHQGREITPNLNALARRSMVFTSAYAQASHTDYALPALLSSQYPLRSKEHYYYSRKEPWPSVRIYDHLHNFGYRTAIISSDTTNWGEVRNFMWSPKLDVFFDAENLPTTFSAKSDNRGYVTKFHETPRTEIKSVPDREVVDFDIAWMRQAIADDRPFFLHSFFYQPHYPYIIGDDVPRPFQPSTMDFESTFLQFPDDKLDVMGNAYCNAVHETDAQIGRLLAFLDQTGQTSNTIIVVTADHGEAFKEHGFSAHAGPLFNEVVHIPCLIFAPGKAPRTETYPVQQIDLAPTVCGLLGLPPHPGFQGIDVLSPDRPPLAERDLFLTAEPPASWRGDVILHAGRWKFWHDRYDDIYYLFDLQNDPEEMADVKNAYPTITAALQQKLQSWRADQLSYYTFKKYYERYYPPDR